MRNSELRRKQGVEFSGKEVFEVKPIVLGGSPVDPQNKTILTREEHIRAVRYWNKIIKDLKRNVK
jgi:hypothetical protein